MSDNKIVKGARYLREWFKNLFKQTPQARGIVSKAAVKAQLPRSFFTKKWTTGRIKNMREALMELTPAQKALAFQEWPGTAWCLTPSQWRQHLKDTEKKK